MNNKKKGLFISFEGPEASGKSTQLKLLKDYLIKNKKSFVVTREPGGTKIAEKLRKIILDKKTKISLSEEILLLMCSRINHINTVIKPALSQGKLVISDRFADSTFVYQGYFNKFGMKKTIDLHKKMLNNFLPDKTFLFLLSSKIINQRLKKRNKSNKYDKIDLVFHNKILFAYKKLSKNNKRFIKIDGTLPTQKIHKNIINYINKII